MHKYLRAIGFSQITSKKQEQVLVKQSIIKAQDRKYVKLENDIVFTEYRCEVGENIGIAICGEFDGENIFIYSHYVPYVKGKYVSSIENVNIEKHMEKDSFAGVCDEPKLGITMIFYLQNTISYLDIRRKENLEEKSTKLILTALSVEGKIVLALQKSERDRNISNNILKKRSNLIKEARKGDEEAIERLTMKDIDTYSSISRKIVDTDIFTLVDTYFMPYGVECDQYSIMGEILQFKLIENKITQEKIYNMTLLCNDIAIELCINKEDVTGEVLVGRRFKGVIWLQGEVNYI